MTCLEIEQEQAGSKGFLRAIYQTRNPHDPLVSVILPVFNREGSVARAISSVLAQTYRPVELIVVDDPARGSVLRRYTNAGGPAERAGAWRHYSRRRHAVHGAFRRRRPPVFD